MKIALGRLVCLLLAVLVLAGCGATAAGPREPVLSVKVVQRAFATEGFHFRVRDPRKMLGAYPSRRWLRYSPVFFEPLRDGDGVGLGLSAVVYKRPQDAESVETAFRRVSQGLMNVARVGNTVVFYVKGQPGAMRVARVLRALHSAAATAPRVGRQPEPISSTAYCIVNTSPGAVVYHASGPGGDIKAGDC
jgi:hypothetical protein